MKWIGQTLLGPTSKGRILIVATTLACGLATGLAVESGVYRLLSIAETSKLLLVSKIPASSELPPPQHEPEERALTKYLLDASTAKITVDGKPAEFNELQFYTLISIKFELRKGKKDGVDIDGVVSEIAVTSPVKPAKPQSSSRSVVDRLALKDPPV